MTPKQMRQAGYALNYVAWTNEELVLAVAGLKRVIPFLEGAGYSRRVIGPLKMEQETFLKMQHQRQHGK